MYVKTNPAGRGSTFGAKSVAAVTCSCAGAGVESTLHLCLNCCRLLNDVLQLAYLAAEACIASGSLSRFTRAQFHLSQVSPELASKTSRLLFYTGEAFYDYVSRAQIVCSLYQRNQLLPAQTPELLLFHTLSSARGSSFSLSLPPSLVLSPPSFWPCLAAPGGECVPTSPICCLSAGPTHSLLSGGVGTRGCVMLLRGVWGLSPVERERLAPFLLL